MLNSHAVPRIVLLLVVGMLVRGTVSAPAQEPQSDGHAATPPETSERERVEQFATAFEQAVNARDTEYVNRSFDVDALRDRALDGLTLDEGTEAGLRQGIRERIAWSETVIAPVGDGGHYKLLAVRQVDGMWRAVYRMVRSGGALNYHNYIIDPSRMRFVDVFIGTAGETLSDLMRRNAATINENSLQDADRFVELGRAHRDGRYEDGLRIYQSLSDTWKRDRAPLLVRLSCASLALDGDEVLRAVEDFRKYHPDDPPPDLMIIDALFYEKKFDEAQTSIENLKKAYFDDPYLDFLSGNLDALDGKIDAAKAKYERALEREPTLAEPMWALLELALDEQDYAEAARWMSHAVTQCDIVFPGIHENDLYAGFIQSPEFEEWRQANTFVDALDESDREWMLGRRESGLRFLADTLGRQAAAPHPTVEELDRGVAAWRTGNEAEDRLGRDDVVLATAVLLGDVLERDLGLVRTMHFDPIDGWSYSLWHEGVGVVWFPVILAANVVDSDGVQTFSGVIELVKAELAAYQAEQQEGIVDDS